MTPVKVLEVFLIFLTLVKTNTTHSQDKDSVRFENQYSLALAAASKGDQKTAIAYYKKALPYSYTLYKRLMLNRTLAVAFCKDNSPDSARKWANKNFDIDETQLISDALQTEVANTYNVTRMLAIQEGRYQEAIAAMQKAIDRLQSHRVFNEVLCAAYLDLGINYWRLSNFNEALIHTEKSLNALEKLSPRPETLRLRCMIMLGLIHWNKRDLTKAASHYRYVLAITGKDIKSHARDHFATCSNLGAIYSDRKQFDSALLYYNKALGTMPELRINAESGHLADSYEAILLNNIGNVYTLQDDFSKAIQFYQQSLILRKKKYGEDHPEIAHLKTTLAESYSGLGRFAEAVSSCQESIRIRKKFFGIGNSKLSQSYNTMGRVYRNNKNYRVAIAYFDSALLNNPKVEFGKMVVYNEINEAFESMLLKMECLLESTSQPDLAAVDRLYNEARGQIGYALSLTDDDMLHNDIYELSDQLFDVYFKANKFSPAYSSRLWEISEFKKASKFTYHIQRLLDGQISQSIRDEEKKIKDSISVYLDKKLRKNADVDSMLFVLSKRHEAFINKIEREVPKYHALKYPTVKTPLYEVQQQLGEGVAILNLFQSKKTIYVMYIDQKHVSLRQKPAALIDSLTTELNEAIFRGQEKDVQKASFVLTKEIFEGAGDLSRITTVKIIPDGTTWKIQFSLLDDGTSASHDYLGQRINMTYLYSFEHQRLLGTRMPDNNNKVLAFSYSKNDVPGNGSLTGFAKFRNLESDLPGTLLEVREISKVWDGDYYFSNLANESNFKKICSDYQIIHLAVHGAFDEFDPGQSRLVFTRDNVEDGQLHAYEIHHLSLNAELAVLTACNSGSGKITSGEGMMSLGRAFSLAGVNSLLLSRWEVSDAIAPTIMKYFYEGLKNGLPKSEALRQAKLKFLQHDADNITLAPYYWDSFYILGDDEPLHGISSFRRNMGYISIAGMTLMCLSILFLYLKRKSGS